MWEKKKSPILRKKAKMELLRFALMAKKSSVKLLLFRKFHINRLLTRISSNKGVPNKKHELHWSNHDVHKSTNDEMNKEMMQINSGAYRFLLQLNFCLLLRLSCTAPIFTMDCSKETAEGCSKHSCPNTVLNISRICNAPFDDDVDFIYRSKWHADTDDREKFNSFYNSV